MGGRGGEGVGGGGRDGKVRDVLILTSVMFLVLSVSLVMEHAEGEEASGTDLSLYLTHTHLLQ